VTCFNNQIGKTTKQIMQARYRVTEHWSTLYIYLPLHFRQSLSVLSKKNNICYVASQLFVLHKWKESSHIQSRLCLYRKCWFMGTHPETREGWLASMKSFALTAARMFFRRYSQEGRRWDVRGGGTLVVLSYCSPQIFRGCIFWCHVIVLHRYLEDAYFGVMLSYCSPQIFRRCIFWCRVFTRQYNSYRGFTGVWLLSLMLNTHFLKL
jgi:hypothetical protein